MKTIDVAAALLLVPFGAALAEGPQKDLAAAGREFALQVCGNCHLVEKGQPAPLLKPPAPSFGSVLARREVDEAWLRTFLSKPHGNLGPAKKMPNPLLADFEIDKLAAYLEQMKSKAK